jgi:hypothetical protein
MVELNEGVSDDGNAATAAAPAETAQSSPVSAAYGEPRRGSDGGAPSGTVTDVAQMFRAAEDQAARYEDGDVPAPAAAAPSDVRQTENADAGVQRAGQILAAATTARWPMYLRNVKQILRQAEGGFDERRYGFGGLMDLLKACQREGFVRIERDRRGGLRVFQGAALQKTVAMPSAPREIMDVEPIESPPGESIDTSEPADIEQMEPIPIDTTAELLGRAKPRKPRARAPRQAAATPTPRPSARTAQPASTRAKPVRKAASPRRSTRKKASSVANDENEN